MRCLRFLCKVCGCHALLPELLAIPVSYDRTEVPLYHGGFADVWEGVSQGRKVAVKVLKLYQCSNQGRIGKVGNRWFSSFAVYADGLTVTFIGVLPGGCNVERTSSSECVAAARSDNDQRSICDGV